MRTLRRCALNGLLLACLFPLAPGALAGVKVPESDHTLWVKIESEPNGVELYAMPAENERPSVKVGTTPCMIAIDLNWTTKWFKKRWELLSVWAPADICDAVLKSDKNYELSLTFVAIKDGYVRKDITAPVLTIKDPGPKWDGQGGAWPSQKTVSFTMSPTEKADGETQAKPARRVILADSQSSDGNSAAGTLSVYANEPDAEVFINKKFIGKAPVQVVVKEGEHTVQVQKAGFVPLRKSLYVSDDAETAYRATLSPIPGE